MRISKQEAAAISDMLEILNDMSRRDELTPEQAETVNRVLNTIGGFMPLEIAAGRASAYTGRTI